MPYIPPQDRTGLDPFIDQLYDELDRRGFQSGELNYCISTMIARQWRKAPSYGFAARIRGVLGDVKDEFYRRFVAPYEDKKIAENGDI